MNEENVDLLKEPFTNIYNTGEIGNQQLISIFMSISNWANIEIVKNRGHKSNEMYSQNNSTNKS